MAVYLVNELLVCLWGVAFLVPHRWSPSVKTGRRLFVSVCFFQMFLLVAFRSQIGYDYFMYSKGFLLMDIEGFSSLHYLDWEVGFVLYTKLVGLFTNNILIYHGVTAAFCLVSWAVFFYRHSRGLWLSVILFLNFYFLYLKMNFLRQAIAIAITLYAWPFLKKRKFWPFAAIVGAAALFHTTALILLLLYPLTALKPGVGVWLFYGYGLLFFYISSRGILDLLTTVFHQEYAGSVFLQGMSFLYGLMPVVLLVPCFLLRKPLLVEAPANRYLLGMLFFTAFCMLMMTRHAILERFSYYSLAYCTLLLPELALSVGKQGWKGDKKGNGSPGGWLLLTVGAAVVTFGYHLFGLLENAHGVVPYQWIF